MSRGNRIALLLAGVLAVGVAGTVFATRQAPQAEEPSQVTQDEEETPPTAEEIAHAADRLREKQIPFEDAALNDLATRFGLGGAVRILAWSNGDAELQAEIIRLREGDGTEEGAMGWGRIVRELDLGVNPGLGSIMGNGGGNGNGHGRENAPGQNRDDEGDAGG